MNSKERDLLILRKIVMYCEQTAEAVKQFGNSEAAFSRSSIYQNACAMCILQIGELAGKLSEQAQANMKAIPWRAIRGMRNIIAHNYGDINVESTWLTVTADIPALMKACEEYLQQK